MTTQDKTPKQPKAPAIDRNHLPEPEWTFPNAKIGTQMD
jgi:hypothetical protein